MEAVRQLDQMRYQKLVTITGRWRAEIIESLLEAHGIDVELFQDSVSHSSYVTTFSRVDIFVPRSKVKLARELLGSARSRGAS
jgi:hypothetical protein